MLLDLLGCWCSGAQGLNVQATDESKSPFPVSEVFPWNSVPLAASAEPDAPPGVCAAGLCAAIGQQSSPALGGAALGKRKYPEGIIPSLSMGCVSSGTAPCD